MHPILYRIAFVIAREFTMRGLPNATTLHSHQQSPPPLSGLGSSSRQAKCPTKGKGAILGKAMTGLASGRGLVLVLVTLQ